MRSRRLHPPPSDRVLVYRRPNPGIAPEPAPRPPPRVAACPRCNVALVATQKRTASVGSVIGLVMFLLGLPIVLFAWPLGLLLIVAGLIMATAIHGSRLAMVCPTCREEC